MTTNGYTYILFKNILNDVQTKGKGEINTALHSYSKIVYFDTISVEGLKSKIFLLILQLCFTIKECKIDFSNKR